MKFTLTGLTKEEIEEKVVLGATIFKWDGKYTFTITADESTGTVVLTIQCERG